jgi:hypothetical protein
VARDAADHPVARVEEMGHGITACRAGDAECAPAPGRLVYTFARRAEVPPRAPGGERVGYDLVSLHDTLWRHRSEEGTLWDSGWRGPLAYAGAGLGRAGAPIGTMLASHHYGASARAPWGLKAATGARGDWFLDPAAVTRARYRLPGGATAAARRYVYHPFLADLRRECAGSACPPPASLRLRAGAATALWGGPPGLLLTLALVLVARRRASARTPAPADAPPPAP